MQVQLSWLEEKVEDGVVSVWSTLDRGQRTEVVTTLARVIAKLAVADHAEGTEEKTNE